MISIRRDYDLDILGAELGVSRATDETDWEYSARLHACCRRAGNGSLSDIITMVSEVPGVKRVSSLSAPPGYVHFRVQGGDDRLIAWTLYYGLPAFVGTKGNTFVADCHGTGNTSQRIRFSRPRWYHLVYWWARDLVRRAIR